MNNNKKTTDKFPRTMVLPDGTVFKAYGVTTINNSFRLATTHKPAMPVDWAFWPASRRVTRDEAIALSLGLDPHSLYSNIDGRINPEFCPDNATAILFLKRLNLLTACNSRTNIPLSEIAAWAVSISLSPIPPELEAIAREHGESVNAPALQNNVPAAPAKVGDGDTVSEAKQAAPVEDKKIPLQRQLFQEQEILRVIKEIGHSPKALPKNKAGKPGVKAEVRAKLSDGMWSEQVFKKAWQRLRDSDNIAEA